MFASGEDPWAPLLAAAVLLLAIASLRVPWWTVELDANENPFNPSPEVEVMPFDPDREATDGTEAVSGVSTVWVGIVLSLGIALIGAYLTVAMLRHGRARPRGSVAPWLLIAGGIVTLLAAGLAAWTWPPEGVTWFWSADNHAAAGLGWYGALLVGWLALALGIAEALPVKAEAADTGKA